MATFFVVPKSAAPRNSDYDGKSFSDTFFLNALKQHIVEAVTFDDEGEDADDMLWEDFPGDDRPLLCKRWAERNGVNASDYFFIVPADSNYVDEEESRAGDEWPDRVSKIFLSWERIDSYCVDPDFIKRRIKELNSVIEKCEKKLQSLTY